MQTFRKVKRIDIDKALFFQCDIQTIFEKSIWKMPAVIKNTAWLTQVATSFEIPIVATIHNSKTFGQTFQVIKDFHPAGQKEFEKLKFSMITDEVKSYMEELPSRNQAIIYGIETHVCIQQTCMDLLSMDYDVHIVADSVSSSRPHERAVALSKLISYGANVTTVESLVFELMRDGTHPKFKSMLKIIKDIPEDPVADISKL